MDAPNTTLPCRDENDDRTSGTNETPLLETSSCLPFISLTSRNAMARGTASFFQLNDFSEMSKQEAHFIVRFRMGISSFRRSSSYASAIPAHISALTPSSDIFFSQNDSKTASFSAAFLAISSLFSPSGFERTDFTASFSSSSMPCCLSREMMFFSE